MAGQVAIWPVSGRNPLPDVQEPLPIPCPKNARSCRDRIERVARPQQAMRTPRRAVLARQHTDGSREEAKRQLLSHPAWQDTGIVFDDEIAALPVAPNCRIGACG